MIREPWVVTYRIDCEGYDVEVGRVASMSIIEFYRGDEDECRRIAAHSAAPMRHQGARVVGFKTIVGPARHWDEFLAD